MLALALSTLADVAFAGAEPGRDPQSDPAPCFSAAAANDHEKIADACGKVIDNEKAAKAERFKALVARAGMFARKEKFSDAIDDYDAALRIDPTNADVFNTRGETWRRLGNGPKAVADFAAAMKLNPGHAAARANHRSLAQELERAGALKAIEGKPSFNCAAARRPVEKEICSKPELANLDREIHGSYLRAIQQARDPREANPLKREQEEFIARRNAQFGKPGYDLQGALRERLKRLNGVDRH